MNKENIVYKKIKELLEENKIEYSETHHKETLTSEDAARERGEDIKLGGKSLVCKVDDGFKVFVVSAAKQIDYKKIKQKFKSKKIRLATREELFDLTGLVPGCIPPFGKPIFDLDLYVDTSIKVNERIAFNAGSLTDSLVISTEDYFKICKGEVFEFGK